MEKFCKAFSKFIYSVSMMEKSLKISKKSKNLLLESRVLKMLI